MSSKEWRHRTLLLTGAPLLIVVVMLVWFAVIGNNPVHLPGPFRGPAQATTPAVETSTVEPGALALPKKLGSLRFAVMGDVGRGDAAQYATAAQMAQWHERFDFSFVLMLGDNIYAVGTPEDYAARFE